MVGMATLAGVANFALGAMTTEKRSFSPAPPCSELFDSILLLNRPM
jgi:hypothetical protein